MINLSKCQIMVVDDTPNNLKLLDQMLSEVGYVVSCFPRASIDINPAIAFPQNLILMDINMPEMDGYTACEKIKNMEKISHIPIIFISALTNTEDKIKAFQKGGVDYITKPFHFEEVDARIKTHIRLKKLQEELAKHNQDLEEMLSERAKELIAANERLKILDQAKSDFLSQISHELRTPLNSVIGVMKMLFANHSDIISSQLVEMFEASQAKLISLLEDALLLTQIKVSGDSFNEEKVCLDEVINDAVINKSLTLFDREIENVNCCGKKIFINADKDLIVKAFNSLLDTALLLSSPGTAIKLSFKQDCDSKASSTVYVETSGYTIPEDKVEKFFEEFSLGTTITPEGDFGLAPALTKQIFKISGAQISAENISDGVRFSVTFPCKNN